METEAQRLERSRRKPLLQKLGVKPDWRASALGIADQAFLAELEGAVAFLSVGRAAKENDARRSPTLIYSIVTARGIPKHRD